jgi:hypothetical protein
MACAIKGCTHQVKTTAYLADLHSRDFVLCDDCESAVVIDTVIAMQATMGVPLESVKQFAACFNGWKRNQRGIAQAHRPQDLGFSIGPRSPRAQGN